MRMYIIDGVQYFTFNNDHESIHAFIKDILDGNRKVHVSPLEIHRIKCLDGYHAMSFYLN